MLASGYAEADPDKAFPLLEDTILRVNDTLAAFIKVGEFIDVAGEMIRMMARYRSVHSAVQ